MSITPIKVASGTGTGGSVTVYTVPAATTLVLKQANFGNTTAGALTFTLACNDGTADRALETGKSINANSSYQPAGVVDLVLPTGSLVKVNAAIGIDYWISGFTV